MVLRRSLVYSGRPANLTAFRVWLAKSSSKASMATTTSVSLDSRSTYIFVEHGTSVSLQAEGSGAWSEIAMRPAPSAPSRWLLAELPAAVSPQLPSHEPGLNSLEGGGSDRGSIALSSVTMRLRAGTPAGEGGDEGA